MRNLRFAVHIACCAMLMVLSAAPGRAQSSEAQRTLERAARLHEAGDLDSAIREYKAFLVLQPNVVEVRSNLGAALARLGRYDEAIDQYKRATALDARNTGVRFNLAVAYFKTAQFEEAVTLFMRIVAEDPSNKNALLLLADCHLRTGVYKKVIELLEPAEAAEPDNLTVAYMLGSAYIRDDQPEKGQMLIDRILRNGESAEAHVLMGSVQLSRDSASAIKEFERAIELSPNLPVVHSLYGKALLRAGDRERALAAFQEELKRNANDFESNMYIGQLLKEDQKYDEAIAYLEKALLGRPRDPGAGYYIAAVKIALGKTAEAQTLLEDVIKQAPDFVEAHVLLATAYYRLKLKDKGDRERLIIQKLNADRQAAAPGAKDGLGPAYRGEQLPAVQPIRKPESKPPN